MEVKNDGTEKAVKKAKVEKGSSQKLPAKTKIFYGIGRSGQRPLLILLFNFIY
jgi:hypothetical protein